MLHALHAKYIKNLIKKLQRELLPIRDPISKKNTSNLFPEQWKRNNRKQFNVQNKSAHRPAEEFKLIGWYPLLKFHSSFGKILIILKASYRKACFLTGRCPLIKKHTCLLLKFVLYFISIYIQVFCRFLFHINRLKSCII